MSNHLFYYPTPANLSYNWSFGSLAGLFFALQIVTVIFLARHYTPHIEKAFASVEHIRTDVFGGSVIRYFRANGALAIFILRYCHVFRNLKWRSGFNPKQPGYKFLAVIATVVDKIEGELEQIIPLAVASEGMPFGSKVRRGRGATLIFTVAIGLGPVTGGSIIVAKGAALIIFFPYHHYVLKPILVDLAPATPATPCDPATLAATLDPTTFQTAISYLTVDNVVKVVSAAAAIWVVGNLGLALVTALGLLPKATIELEILNTLIAHFWEKVYSGEWTSEEIWDFRDAINYAHFTYISKGGTDFPLQRWSSFCKHAYRALENAESSERLARMGRERLRYPRYAFEDSPSQFETSSLLYLFELLPVVCEFPLIIGTSLSLFTLYYWSQFCTPPETPKTLPNLTVQEYSVIYLPRDVSATNSTELFWLSSKY